MCMGSQVMALSRVEAVQGAVVVDAFEGQFVSRLKTLFAERMALEPDAFELRTESLSFYPAIPADLISRVKILEIMGLGTVGAQRPDGLFAMSVSLKFPDASVREHQVSGLLHVTGPVWVTRENLNRGRVVQVQDLELVRMPWAQLATGVALTSSDELVGRSLRRLVNRGTPLMAAFLETAPSVKVGDLVELTVQAGPGVFIRSRAVARQEGRLGESIRVEQSDTRRTLQAVVTGDKAVEVQL